jgi:hypothetical protein
MILPSHLGAYFALNSSYQGLAIAQFSSGGPAAIDVSAVVIYASLAVF